MAIGPVLALNIAAVVALLALLTAAMRLPYRLSSPPRGATRVPETAPRHRQTAPAGRPSRERRGTPEPVYSR
jgi:hypothetical protein